MKSLFISLVLLFASAVFAAPEKQDVTNAELQSELEALDENLVLDQEDQAFLDADTESKSKSVVWGKVIEPVKKAQAPVEKPVTKQ